MTAIVAPSRAAPAAPHGYREYTDDTNDAEKKDGGMAPDTVKRTYRAMLQNQTEAFVAEMKRKYCSAPLRSTGGGGGYPKTVWEAMALLDTILDESDPDTDLPQIVHSFQTAEAARLSLGGGGGAAHVQLPPPTMLVSSLFSPTEWQGLPSAVREGLYGSKAVSELWPQHTDWSWFVATAFIHDLGKVLLTPDFGALPQWAVVGDTFPVGLPLDPSYPFADCGFHRQNPSLSGVSVTVPEGCGLDRLEMSWGHDEFLARVIERSGGCRLPPEAVYIIRFHSFYPWHTPRCVERSGRGYAAYATERDWRMLPLLKLFQRADLYSKVSTVPDVAALQGSFYGKLLEHWLPDGLNW